MKLLDYCYTNAKKVPIYQGEMKYIATGDIVDNSIISGTLFTYDKRPSRANVMIDNNDVIFAKMKGATKVLFGDDTNKNNIYSTGFYCLTAKGNCNPKFLYYYINSNLFNIQKDKNCSGAIMESLNDKGLKNIEVDFPNLDKQNEIVEKLDLYEKAIDNKINSIVDLKKLISSLFSTKFDNADSEKKSLNDISIIQGEYGSGASAVDYDGKVRYVRITDIDDSGRLLMDTIASPDNETNLSKYKLEYGDIIFARTGATVGKTYIYNDNDGYCIYAGYCIRFRLNLELVDPTYIFAFTKTNYYKDWIKNKQRVVAQPNINAKEYGNDLLIPIPSIELQKNFAEKYNSINSLIIKYEDDIKDLKQLMEIMITNSIINGDN